MQHTTATKGTILSWGLFDFANTGFYVIMITLVFPIYFTDVLAGGSEAYWGRTISISMLLTAIIGPFLGSVADSTSNKKLFLGIFTAACVAATAALYGATEGMLIIAAVLLIIANIGFEGGTIFYDAFIGDISTKENYAKISGFGFAMGYLGSFIILLIVLPILTGDPTQQDIRSTFVIAAAFFALFSIPMFVFVKEHKLPHMFQEKNAFARGYLRLKDTITHLRRYRDVRHFLLAFFVYNDSILTVILFSSLFAKTVLNFSTEELIYFFMIVQGTALVGSLVFGLMTNKLGARQVLGITLVIWIGIVVSAYFVQTKEAYFIVGAVAGLALGSSQSTSRTLMALLTPDEKMTEFFGFYDGFFGKASAILGPLIFGEVAAWLGQRPAMLVVGVLFLLGIALLFRVPDVRPQPST